MDDAITAVAQPAAQPLCDSDAWQIKLALFIAAANAQGVSMERLAHDLIAAVRAVDLATASLACPASPPQEG